MRDALAERPVSRRLLGLLIILLALVVIPHINNLGPWILGFFGGSILLRLGALRIPALLPGRWLLGLLMLLGIGLVITQVGFFDGRLAGTALLVVMIGLKLLELKNRRDVYVCVFLGFFVVMTQFLYSSSLWLAVYLLALTGLLSSLLVALNRVRTDLRQTAITTALAMLGALPLAIVLFVVFPRLDSPLWSIDTRAGRAITGLSDELRMGSVSELAQSQAVAFHVRFANTVPPPKDRYWRGIVLWEFDGETWHVSPDSDPPRALQADPDSRIDYELTLEPSHQPWLFPLEMAAVKAPKTAFNRAYQMIYKGELSERTSFELSSHTRYRALDFAGKQRQLALQLPQVSPRVAALAAQWRNTHRDPKAIVQAALRFFNQQDFVYTLKPGVLEGDPVESFLFETRRGFCEHYASSFAVLMRLAGIPTRIVTGYQGGEYNPHADHWIVRQSDAHAWNEVWFEQEGWVRIDPTAAVAAERVENAIDTASSSERGEVVFNLGQLGLLDSLMREAYWLANAADLGWHRWVLGFGKVRQQSLLQQLGFDEDSALPQVLSVFGVFALVMLSAHLAGKLQSGQGKDQDLQLWLKLLAILRQKGLQIPPWSGPQQVLQLAAARWPQQSDKLELLVRLYIQLRYGAKATPQLRRQLREGINALRLS